MKKHYYAQHLKKEIKGKSFLVIFLILLGMSPKAQSQINNYIFSQTTEPYQVLGMDSTLGNSTSDDQNFNGIRTGFPFLYNNQTYDRVSINFNGFMVMGPVSGYTFSDACVSVANASGRVLNSTNVGSTNNLVSAYNMDIQATGFSTFGIKRQGTAPNRVFIAQWNNVRRYASSGGSDTINFQIRLLETGNQIEFRYGRCKLSADQATPLLVQVGLRGNSASEFACRRSDSNWATTTTGLTNFDGIAFSTTVAPPSGLILKYAPLPPAQNDLAMVGILSPLPPSEGCNLGTDEKIKVIIRNNGTLAQTSLPMAYRLNNGNVVDQTFTRATPLASGQRDTLTFTQGINLTAIGNYSISAYTKLATELPLSRANDTISNYTIKVTPARNLPQPIVTTLSVGQQSGWKSGVGKTRPTGTTSGWTIAFPFATETIALTSPADQGNVQDWIYSPNINVTEFSVLIFKAALTGGSFGSSAITTIGDDTVKVMVSTNCGTTWTVLKAFKQNDLDQDTIRNSLREYRYKLINSPTGTVTIAYFFTNNNTPSQAGTYRFHLDDIEIREIPPFDAGTSLVIKPGSAAPGCALSAQEQVSAIIRNYGSSSFSTIDVGYQVNNGPVVSQTFTFNPPLASGSSDTITFSAGNGANLSQPGTYNFTVFTNLSGELASLRANDTLKNYIVTLSPPFAIPTPLFSNLNLLTANSWSRGRGITSPTGTAGNWFSSTALRGIETISALSSSSATAQREWLYSPTYTVTPDAIFVFKLAVARGNTSAQPGANMLDDTLKLMVSEDCGLSWKMLRRFSQQDVTTGVINDTLKRFAIPLTQFGNRVSFAFFFNNQGTPATVAYRIYVKDIQVRNPLLNNDIGVISILEPTNNIAFCTLGTQVPVRVVVSNFGLLSQTSSSIGYRIGNGPETTINTTFSPSPLLPGAIDTITFSGVDGASFIETGVFNLKAYTKLSTEDPGGIQNDTLTGYRIDIRPAQIGSAFLEFFDNNLTTPPSWIPGQTLFANQAFSVKAGRGFGGSNAISVLLSSNNPAGTLNTPRFKIPAGQASILRFKYRLVDNSGESTTLRGQDSIVVRYTKDCGTTYKTFIRIDSVNYNINNQYQDTAKIFQDLAGQEVMFTIQARVTKTDTSRANFEIDNWIIEQTLSANELLSKGSVHIYPNPASEQIMVSSFEDKLKSIRIMSLTGQKIQSHEKLGSESEAINTSNLSPGIYLVEIVTNKTRTVKKLEILK